MLVWLQTLSTRVQPLQHASQACRQFCAWLLSLPAHILPDQGDALGDDSLTAGQTHHRHRSFNTTAHLTQLLALLSYAVDCLSVATAVGWFLLWASLNQQHCCAQLWSADTAVLPPLRCWSPLGLSTCPSQYGPVYSIHTALICQVCLQAQHRCNSAHVRPLTAGADKQKLHMMKHTRYAGCD